MRSLRTVGSFLSHSQAELPQVGRRGGWTIIRQSTGSVAVREDDSEQIELTGELELSLWSDGRLLRSLAVSNEAFGDLGSAELESAPHWSLSRLLAPSGWGHLFIELTGKCNERCAHCYADSSPEVESALDWPTIRRCLESAKGLGFHSLQFTGGDPLVSPHLLQVVEFARKISDWRLEIYTNALALREREIDLFLKTKSHLAVSIYSHEPEVHDRVTRVPGSHERTVRHVKNALKAGLPVRIGSVQGCTSGQDESKLRAFLAELGIAQQDMAVDRQREVGRGQWTPETTLLPLASPSRHTQRSDRGKLSISYSGDVVPCIFDRRTVLGSVHQEPLERILQKPVVARQTQVQLKTVGEPLACSDCQRRRTLLERLTW